MIRQIFITLSVLSLFLSPILEARVDLSEFSAEFNIGLETDTERAHQHPSPFNARDFAGASEENEAESETETENEETNKYEKELELWAKYQNTKNGILNRHAKNASMAINDFTRDGFASKLYKPPSIL